MASHLEAWLRAAAGAWRAKFCAMSRPSTSLILGSGLAGHFNVTTNPTAQWVIQQLREAFASESDSRYQLRDPPVGRPTENRPLPDARIIGLPRVGGLHHRYVWREAA